MARTIHQVFDAHREAFQAGDLEKLVAGYAEDAILLTMDGAAVGKEAIQGFFESVFKSFPNLKLVFEETAAEGDVFLLRWSGESDVAAFPHGVATFVIRNGEIQRQTEWFALVPKEAAPAT